jgi:hypothetical protein
MSTVEISLRLSGTLPPLEQLTQALGVAPTQSLRRGEQVSKRRVQPVDLWRLDLVKFDSDCSSSEIDQQLKKSAALLQRLAPQISKLDRDRAQADLYISTIREEDQGGFTLPSELVVAAAAAHLSIQFSILVMLEDEIYTESKTSTYSSIVSSTASQ